MSNIKGIKHYFAKGGIISQRLPAFEVRPQQAEMAAAVEGALLKKQNLLVEAGTGVGKSLSYLLPAALWAINHGKRVVVATETKALQAQLFEKDLPLIRDILSAAGKELKFHKLVGSGDYLCKLRYQRVNKCSDKSKSLGFDSEARSLENLRTFAASTRTGNVIDIDPHRKVGAPLWAQVCRDPEKCTSDCKFKAECYYFRDRRIALMCQIVVENQSLYFATVEGNQAEQEDKKAKKKAAAGRFPEYDAVIIDEAHTVEEKAAEFLGVTFSDKRLKKFLDEVCHKKINRGIIYEIADAPASWVADVEKVVSNLHKESHLFFGTLRDKIELNSEEGKEYTPDKAVENTLDKHLRQLYPLLAQMLQESKVDTEKAELSGLGAQCLALQKDLDEFLKGDRTEFAYWVEGKAPYKADDLVLRMAPVDISEHLRKKLFELGKPVILTSATLTATRGDFSMIKQRLGVSRPIEIKLDSPYNFEAQTVQSVPHNVVAYDYKAPQPHTDSVVQHLKAIAEAVPQGILVLFTNWDLLNQCYERLEPLFSTKRLLLRQDKTKDTPSQEKLRQFKADGKAILLGVATFWQGIDVQGPALSCVVIPQLPFAPGRSPLDKKRREYMEARGLSHFVHYALPKAIIKFRQGCGRLIRGKDDYGSIVVLDGRYMGGHSYAADFRNSIPMSKLIRKHEELAVFHKRTGKAASANTSLRILSLPT
jgi:ATP-dependent DNA helicase DinG